MSNDYPQMFEAPQFFLENSDYLAQTVYLGLQTDLFSKYLIDTSYYKKLVYI